MTCHIFELGTRIVTQMISTFKQGRCFIHDGDGDVISIIDLPEDVTGGYELGESEIEHKSKLTAARE